MKMRLTLKTLLLLAGICHSINSYAASVTPMVPEAYEPFLVEVMLPNFGVGGNIQYFIDLDSSDNTILIGYLNHGPVFIAPPFYEVDIEIQGLPPGNYSVKTTYAPNLASGILVTNDTGLNFTVAEAPRTQQVYALFNSSIEHYFVTASDQEADGLLPQSSWQIVDFGFNVWHADDPAPSAAVPVCRFYSELVNSHFYTGDANECTMLQEEDHGWEYEGIAFQALLPVDGACPAGTAPVWRLYNNRFEQLDSNHRFIASAETYRSMIAEGWVGEGVAFCSPPASP